MRLTIGNRIFAIAASMTLMMALTAIVSSYFMENANGEFRRVAKTYIPLSKAIEEIQDHAKELELLFRWILPPLLARDTAAPMDPILKKFQEMYLSDHVEYQSDLQLLIQAQKEEQFIQFKVELARLTALMEPFLILIMVGIVVVIILATLVPLLQVTSSLS